MAQTVNIYPFSNHTVKRKDLTKKCKCIHEHVARLKLKYGQEGMRTTVEGIIVVHDEEGHGPLVLFLLIEDAILKLPGGRLRQGENEIDGLKRKLTKNLALTSQDVVHDWQIGECVAVWWRPNFEVYEYPYCPPHITKPKECRKLFLVHLAEKESLQIPTNCKLVSIALSELYKNEEKCGPVLAAIPQMLSRFEFKRNAD